MVRSNTATVRTADEFLVANPCGLEDPYHAIDARFAEVLHAFEDAFDDVEAEAVAGGCNGCTTTDADVWAYYVAQGRGTDTLFVGFGASDDVAIGSKLVAYVLKGVAEEMGVPVSWNGDTSNKVCLGDASYYDDE